MCGCGRSRSTSGREKRRSYTVRWVVDGREKSQTFSSRALADNYRSDLMQAISRGEAFDVETGLPESMTPKVESWTWMEFAIAYVSMKWPGAAAKSRASMVEALATATPVLMRDIPGQPSIDLLRRALRDFILPPPLRGAEPPEEVAIAVRWLQRATFHLTDLITPAVTRGALDALALRLDGKPAAATTMRRKRAVFYNALEYAVDLEELPFNPIDKLKVRNRRTKVVVAVDRRVVVSPRQARELLIAVSYVGSRAGRASVSSPSSPVCTLPRSDPARRSVFASGTATCRRLAGDDSRWRSRVPLPASGGRTRARPTMSVGSSTAGRRSHGWYPSRPSW
jgi:hypothetical protein